MHVTKLISLLAGTVAHWPLPGFVGPLSVRTFARLYHIDAAEASKPLAAYRTIGELFVRDLRPGARAIGSGIVSPVDGMLRGGGTLEGPMIADVKGCAYSVEELLSGQKRWRSFVGGTYFNFYLSPHNYHHVHAPLSGRVSACTRVPGSLWPVNDYCMRTMRRLFVRNARAVVYLQTEAGLVAVVLIGALNVGSIVLRYDVAQGTRVSGHAVVHEEFGDGGELQSGERMGAFQLGSSVVLLFEPGRIALPQPIAPNTPVRYGQTIAEVAHR